MLGIECLLYGRLCSGLFVEGGNQQRYQRNYVNSIPNNRLFICRSGSTLVEAYNKLSIFNFKTNLFRARWVGVGVFLGFCVWWIGFQ